MCDSSLMEIPNRLAVSGEELVIHRFDAGSVGLAGAFDLRRRQEYRKTQSHGFWSRLKGFLNPPDIQSIPAVCIPPGARLLVQDIPAKLQHEYGFQGGGRGGVYSGYCRRRHLSGCSPISKRR
jgi:hypothetical protein